jgi:hypothetical protein
MGTVGIPYVLSSAGIGDKRPHPAGWGERAGDGIRTHGESANSQGNPQDLIAKGSKSGSSSSDSSIFDTELQAIVDAWPTLPADVRKMIVGVVKLTPKGAQ